jgi:starch synthase (maltosyl-transferring)
MMPMGFEYGARKKPHVVNSRPMDWEEGHADLTCYIRKVNSIKEENTIFQEEAPTEILRDGNPNVLMMWKGSVRTQQESLLILNKDIDNKQHFSAHRLQDFVQAGAPLVDISPEDRLDYVPEPFSYDLLPGHGIVLVTTRDPVPED